MIIDSLILMSSSFEAHPFILSPLFASNEPIAFVNIARTRGVGVAIKERFLNWHTR